MAENNDSNKKRKTRSKVEAFRVAAHRQSAAVAASQHEREDQRFIDVISDESNPDTSSPH